MIVVNVPEFVLRAYEVRDGTVSVALTMKVIVGKAVKTHAAVRRGHALHRVQPLLERAPVHRPRRDRAPPAP
jgi:hypothetical protein